MKILCLFMIILSANASVPTMEGLFRNSSSADITHDVVVILTKSTVDRMENGEKQVLDEKVEKERYSKYIIENKENGRMIISRYKSPSMSPDSLENVTIYKDINNLVKNENGMIKNILGSMMLMYGKNSSKGFLSLFKGISQDFKSNEEILNGDKKKLLDEYKTYLVSKVEHDKRMKLHKRKDNPVVDELLASEEDKLVSPMNPEQEDEKVRVQELVSSSMYTKSSGIQLIKEQGGFLWEVKLNGLTAKFGNEDHRLKQMKIGIDKEYEVITNDYVTFAGIYSVPKSFEITSDKFHVKNDINNFYTIRSSNKSFDERIEDYKKYKAEMDSRKNKIVDNRESQQTVATEEDTVEIESKPIDFESIIL